MLDDVDDVPWVSFPQPERNAPSDVPSSLRALASCSTEDEARDAYNRFLFAIGNNHAGTYYPVVLPTLPFLAKNLESEYELSRRATLDVLVDLLGSFAPAIEFEGVDVESGRSGDLRFLLRVQARRMLPVIRAIADEGSSTHTRSATLAAELVELLPADEG